MITDILKDAILSNIGPLKSAPKNWQKRNCPLCHTQGQSRDTRHRFGIQFNPTSIAMNCFNCKFHASYTENKELTKSFKLFLKQINIDDTLVKHIEFQIFTQRNNIVSVREGDVNEAGERVPKLIDLDAKYRALFTRWKPVDLPKDAMPITEWLSAGLTSPDFMKVVDYALKRRIFDLDNFYWTPYKEFNLNERLIIPYYYRNKVVGFTSRLCYNTDGKTIPKYYQQCPPDFVYNLDHQQDWRRKYVIVNEGVLDAWVTDGVGILGEITQPKIDIINRLQKEVIVCPDRDKTGGLLVQAALDNNWSVSYPEWDTGIKDASAATEKYGALLTTHSIIDAAATNRTYIKLNWEIKQNERERKRN